MFLNPLLVLVLLLADTATACSLVLHAKNLRQRDEASTRVSAVRIYWPCLLFGSCKCDNGHFSATARISKRQQAHC